MEENIKIMLKVRKLDINFQSHTRKPENLFLKLLTGKKIGFCENMDKFKNLDIPMNIFVVFCCLQITRI